MESKGTVRVHVWRRTTDSALAGAAASEQTTVEEEGRCCHHAPEMSGNVPVTTRDGFARSGRGHHGMAPPRGGGIGRWRGGHGVVAEARVGILCMVLSGDLRIESDSSFSS
jgi:hypothetical protein